MVFPCIPTCNYMKQWGTKVGVYSRGGGHLFDIFKDNKNCTSLSATCSLKNYKCLFAWEIMLILVNNFHEKSNTESQDRQNFNSAQAICNLLLCYNFPFILHEKCTCFQPISCK